MKAIHATFYRLSLSGYYNNLELHLFFTFSPTFLKLKNI